MIPHSYSHSKKGFTLIELLIVTVIIAVLAVVALTSTLRAQDQFQFLGAVKETSNKVREIRNYALSNKTIIIGTGDAAENIIPYKYGACIKESSDQLILFSDYSNEEATLNYYDDGEELPNGIYELPEKYHYEVFPKIESSANGCDLTILYEATSAKFSVLGNLGGDSRSYIRIYEEDPDGEGEAALIREKYIVMFIVAGNPETFNSLDDTNK